MFGQQRNDFGLAGAFGFFQSLAQLLASGEHGDPAACGDLIERRAESKSSHHPGGASRPDHFCHSLWS
jgi:hypothetical protein